MQFGDIDKQYCVLDSARVVILPFAYDVTSTWIKGADKGPAAIIEASANMELYDIETDTEVYKLGIYTHKTLPSTDITPEALAPAVNMVVGPYLSMDKFVVTIGGNHSVSIGSVHAHAQHYDNLSVLQLDAHADLRDEYDGSKYNHACVMARVGEHCPIVQVGIRSMCTEEQNALDATRAFLAKDIHCNRSYVEKAISQLTENVYITVDLDVFDPSIMPSTGTPEPGGLLWYDVLALLKAVCDNRNVVGFDVVELCPNPNNKAPDFLAAKLIYKLLSYRFSK